MTANKFPSITFSDALKRLENYPLDLTADITEIISNLGSIDPEYFHHNYKGGLELQQVPEELSQLSRALIRRYRGLKIKYLEVGVGSCATLIFLSHLFKKNGIEASLFAIDNLNHFHTGLLENQKSRIEWCQKNIGLTFFDMDSTKPEFTDWLKGLSYDVILVDGDHSFEGCLWDFSQCTRSLKKDGWIILHDITSDSCPGVGEVFEFGKKIFSNSYTYSSSNTCGIGVLEGPPESDEILAKALFASIKKIRLYSEKQSSTQSDSSTRIKKWIKNKGSSLIKQFKS